MKNTKKYIIAGALSLSGALALSSLMRLDLKASGVEGRFTELYNVDNLVISSDDETKNNTIFIKIENNTDRDIQGIEFQSELPSGLLYSQSNIKESVIKSGETKVFKLHYLSVANSSLIDAINEMGGYVNFIPIATITLMGIVYTLAFRKKNGAFVLTLISVSCIVAVAGNLMSYVESNKEYSGQEEVIKIESEVPYKDGKMLTYSGELHFFKDKVEIIETSSEKEVDFKTVYIPDEHISILDEPKVITEGIKGEGVETVKKTVVNGKVEDIDKTLVITSEPVDEVVKQGTMSKTVEEKIDPNISYVPSDKMYVGETEFNKSASGSVDLSGIKEVTYTWNKEKQKVETSEKITKEPGTEVWNAGTLLKEEKILKADVEYVADNSKEIGYKYYVEEPSDGVEISTYQVEINSKTGKMIKDSPLTHIKTERKEPVSGKIEVGVLKTYEEVKDIQTKVQEDPEQWTNYKEVVSEGVAEVDEVTVECGLNKETGEVIQTESKEVKREVKTEGSKRIEIVGTKEPKWVKEVVLGEEIKYNTEYVDDTNNILKEGEELEIRKGENGRIISEYRIACDENDNPIEGYEKELITDNKIQEPVNRIVMVNNANETVEKPKAKEEPIEEPLKKESHSSAFQAIFLIINIGLLIFNIIGKIFKKKEDENEKE